MIDQKSTKIRTQGNKTIVRLYETDIVSFDDESITLNHGGFKTPTTKRRMNQVSETFNLRFKVIQEDFIWFVEILAYKNDSLISTRKFEKGKVIISR